MGRQGQRRQRKEGQAPAAATDAGATATAVRASAADAAAAARAAAEVEEGPRSRKKGEESEGRRPAGQSRWLCRAIPALRSWVYRPQLAEALGRCAGFSQWKTLLLEPGHERG